MAIVTEVADSVEVMLLVRGKDGGRRSAFFLSYLEFLFGIYALPCLWVIVKDDVESGISFPV